MVTESFTHLHVHSQYSQLDGKSTVAELVDTAIAEGMHGMALTDHGNMYGIKEFLKYCDDKNSKLAEGEMPFKPIVGCEMYVAKDRQTDHKDKSDNGYHLIVLAKNQKGYHNLIKLVSKAWTDGFYYKPRTDRYELEAHAEGLIVCSACLGGEIPQFIMNNDIKAAEERAAWYKRVFGDDYYIELQRHETFKENANRQTYEEQKIVNEELIKIARKLGIKIVATNDVHFAHEDDAEAHDRLICISTNKKYSDERMHYTKQEWLKSTEQMCQIFSDLPEAIQSTKEILDKVEVYSIDHAPIMPAFDIPETFGTEESYRKKFSEKDLFDEFTCDENGNVVLSQEEAENKVARLGGYDRLYRIKLEADYLAELTNIGAKKRYGDPLPEDVVERLKFELHIMKTMGFPGYFLIVQDFITAAREKLGVSVGPGRGSAAGSAVAYCLGITQIDPLKYDLLFERFLNPDRISLPDIDVDFDDDGRKEVLKYVTQKYGEEKVAHIITYQTMAMKMAIKDMGRVLNLPIPESNRISNLVPDRLPDVNGKKVKINFKNCIAYDKDFAAEANSQDPVVRDVIKYASQLEGNVRGTGVHACGVIIGRDDITDWVPVSMATDADNTKVITTQYEGSVIEETGLIKMDFLGLKTLSIIKEALANIKATKGIDLDIDHIPLDDPATFKLYSEGRTTATFQFESWGMQSSLRELKPSKFEDLIAMNALYRPGPMAYIPSFIARKHGKEPIEYDIPVMKKYLEETYGITVYQEQVMLLSRLLANFTRGESDVLRKAMGKKQLDKMAKLEVKFYAGGEANGYDRATLEKIWNDWKKFAEYAFNKSHATCYSWVAYQTAYLKANYPAEYMAGVLSRNLTNTTKLRSFMDECRRMGIEVKCPDINESIDKFNVNRQGQIRFGLAGISGVGGNAVSAIVSEREANGPYTSIYDFVERVNLGACNRAAIENLAMAGAFDCFEDISREMFVTEVNGTTWADVLVKYGQRFQADKQSTQASLFDVLDDMEEELETDKPPYPHFTPWDRLTMLDKEVEKVLVYLSSHPLDDYEMEVKYGCNCPCGEFDERKKPGARLTLGGLVTKFQVRTSQKGKPYGLLEVEDYSGKAEMFVFGKSYETYAPMFVKGAAIYVSISVAPGRFDPSRLDINIEEIRTLADMKGKIANALTINLDVNFEQSWLSKRLIEISGPKGNSQLFINFYDSESNRHLRFHARDKIMVDPDLLQTLKDADIDFKISSIQ